MGNDAAAVRALLLVVLLVGTWARGRFAVLERRLALWLLALVVVGAATYLAAVRVHPGSGAVHIHYWDVYHYYVGTRYFAELGQDGIYEATVVADFEDDRAGFRPRTTIRDLTHDQEELNRRSVVQRAGAVRSRFSPDRWQAFKRDIAFFRAVDPPRWRSSEIQRDHGYNGTPLTTALLGALANCVRGPPDAFLLVVVWLDLLLVGGVGAWIGLRLGWVAAATFWLFWLVNPLNDYDFTGGSFLRFNYLLALALGVTALRAGKRAASGVWLALAGLFRIFPFAFVFALLAHDLLRRDRLARLRENRAVYLASLATVVVVVGATSWVPSPDAGNPWLQQLEIVGTRNAMHAPNGISLRFPFLYASEHDVDAVVESARRGEPIDWLAETRATFERRRPWYFATLSLLALAGVLYARRVDALESLLVAVVAIYGVLILSHYYYALLGLIPLANREDRGATGVLAGGMLAIAAIDFVPALRESLDWRYAVTSVEVGVTLAGLLALPWLRGRPSRVERGVTPPGEAACA